MGYQEFLYAVEKELNKRLKEGVKASVYTAVKNNGKEKKGVMIERTGSNTAPTIYLEGFFVRFQRGESMEKLIGEIMSFYESVGKSKSGILRSLRNTQKSGTRSCSSLSIR